MNWATRFIAILVISAISLFQNCSPSHDPTGGSHSLSSFDISQIYPYYLEKPDFFNNVQLTEVKQVDKVWEYQFIASAVDAENPSQKIDVNIQIRDQNNELLCVSKTVRVSSSKNTIAIDNCKSSEKASIVNIKVFIKPAAATSFPTTPTSTYKFNIDF